MYKLRSSNTVRLALGHTHSLLQRFPSRRTVEDFEINQQRFLQDVVVVVADHEVAVALMSRNTFEIVHRPACRRVEAYDIFHREKAIGRRG